MKHHLKKIASLMLALAMVLALGTTAFAVNGQDTSAYYYQGDAEDYETSEAITVYMTIESYKNSDGNALLQTRIPVTLDPDGTSKTFTVADALVALSESDPQYTLYTADWDLFTANDEYMKYLVYDEDQVYGPSDPYSYDGWMVRINDRFALLEDDPAVGGLKGAEINKTYLSDGDYIHLYMDNTQTMLTCAKYTKLTPVYDDGTLTVDVEESHNWFNSYSPFAWNITPFAAYSVPEGTTFTIYEGNGVCDSTTYVTEETGSGDSVEIDCDELVPGQKYTVVMSNSFAGATYTFTSSSSVFTA